jgi:hypothetical protein
LCLYMPQRQDYQPVAPRFTCLIEMLLTWLGKLLVHGMTTNSTKRFRS